jgi:hypothetical protein
MDCEGLEIVPPANGELEVIVTFLEAITVVPFHICTVAVLHPVEGNIMSAVVEFDPSINPQGVTLQL